MKLNIVLVEPEIPNNTGNIGRLCVGSNSSLHLVKPLGFEINDKRVKRAGLDYWPKLNLKIYESIEAWKKALPINSRVFFMSAKAQLSFYQIQLRDGDWVVFGRESTGLPDELLVKDVYKIPFNEEIRGFNVANAVAMAIGESIRQSS